MPPPKIYGLIGYPVKHSLSPAMHNAAFKALKINAEYRLFEIHPVHLEDFLLRGDFKVTDAEGNSCRAGDIIGFNITIPHKVKATEILEKKFPFNQGADRMNSYLYYVKLTGAVNTVKRLENKLEYWHTDAAGFLISLEKDLKFEPKNKNILLVGCGGAGRAVIAALSWKDVGVKKIYAYDINPQAVGSAKNHFSQFEHLQDRLKFILKKEISTVINDCQLLINASFVGMKDKDPSVIDKNLLHKGLSVYDVVYNRRTQLLDDAKDSGLSAVGGLGMLLYQGIIAFELLTGEKIQGTQIEEEMRQVLEGKELRNYG